MTITIIEYVLATIFIIGLMAVLLYPALNGVRESQGLDWHGRKLP